MTSVMPVPTSTYAPSRITHSTVSSSSAAPPSPDRKKIKKENQFIYRKGSKLNAYDRDKAPYPYSYDKEVLEWSCIDHSFLYGLNRSVSWINFREHTPMRCLDLGTGLGDWCVDAAKEWKDCTFVGYDLVNVQLPLTALEPDIAARIQWVHGNFLRQRLPFEDDEFDHVHIQGLAFAVPENKWHSLYEEVHRVLSPGGTVEVIEDDAIFPVLPKWFTAPLHTPVPHDSTDDIPGEVGDSFLPKARVQEPNRISVGAEHLPHAHALLESLFYSVFYNRFLNSKPSSMLPSYFSAFFSHVVSPPVINFPMPPFAPLRPSPPSHADTPSSAGSYLTLAGIDSDSPRSSGDTDMSIGSIGQSILAASLTRSSSISSLTSVGSSTATKRPLSVASLHSEGTMISGSRAVELFPLSDVAMLGEQHSFMELQRAVTMVIGLKEAMWEELKEKINKDEDSLKTEHGWEESDFDAELGNRDYGASRQKFDSMVQQYKSDMQKRISLWYSMTENGWQLPRRPTLSKSEAILEQRMKKAILEAEKNLDSEELSRPCRSVRLLVGVKSM